MSFLSIHKNNILKSSPITISELRMGMIVEIQYKSSTKKEVSKSIYLILNPKFDTNIHVLDLSEFPVKTLYELFQYTENKKPMNFIHQYKTFTKFVFGKTSKTLYESVLKNSLCKSFPNSYKQLLRTRISDAGIMSMKLIDYKWDQSKFETVKEPIKPIKPDKQ